MKFRIDIWNNLQGDFIAHRENGKVKTYDSEAEAADAAMALTEKSGQPTKVVYIRRQFTDQRAKRANRSGRIHRYQTTFLDGERVRIIGVINSRGDKIK